MIYITVNNIIDIEDIKPILAIMHNKPDKSSMVNAKLDMISFLAILFYNY